MHLSQQFHFRYLESQVGCSPPHSKGPTWKPPCRAKSELEQLLELTGRLAEMTEREAHELTGCLPPCVRDEFSVRPRLDLDRVEIPGGKGDTLGVWFSYASGIYEVFPDRTRRSRSCS